MAPTLDSSLASVQESKPVGFQQMLDEIRTAFSQPDQKVDVDEIWRVLEGYKSNPDDWNKFAFYDAHKYKRNLVDEHEKYNVMILTWGPKVKSCIHDHAGAHCFMKVLDGELIESRFAWPHEGQVRNDTDSEMIRLLDSRMELDDVLYINDKVGLHRVENVSQTKSAASLHVYIPPFRKCKAFDQRTGKSLDCKLNFYSKRGKIIKEEEEK